MQPSSMWIFEEAVRSKCASVKVSKTGDGNKYRMHFVKGKSQGEPMWRLQFTRSKLCWLS